MGRSKWELWLAAVGTLEIQTGSNIHRQATEFVRNVEDFRRSDCISLSWVMLRDKETSGNNDQELQK